MTTEQKCRGHLSAMHRDACPICNPDKTVPELNAAAAAHVTSNLWSIHVDLIRMAAQLARGEGVPDWSEHTFYRSTPVGERRDMMKALRDADEALRSYGSRLKAIADKVSAEIRAPGPVQTEVCPVCHTVHDDPRCPAPEPRIEPRCPRPCNGRPDDFTMAQCILAGECGCTKAACEARAAGETGAEPAAWLLKLEDGWRYLGSTREFAEHCQRLRGGVLVPLYERPAEKTSARQLTSHDDAISRIEQCVREIEIICDEHGFDPVQWLMPDIENDVPPDDVTCSCGHHERYHFDDGRGAILCRYADDCGCSRPADPRKPSHE